MIVLYQFPGAYGLRSLSPFCTKVETYLRLTRTPYQSRVGSPIRAPRGKLPYASLGEQWLPDSQRIIDTLERSIPQPLDGELDAATKARAHVVRRMVEEHLYFAIVTMRWCDDEIWAGGYRRAIARCVPAVARPFLPWILRRKVRAMLHGQGLGRLDSAELGAAARADLAALQQGLGQHRFLLGERLTSLDCSAYAMLKHIQSTPAPDHPVRAALGAHPALLDYLTRIDERLDATSISSESSERTRPAV